MQVFPIKLLFNSFSHSNTHATNFNLVVKLVNVNPGSYVELGYSMLHAKFQDHRISGSGEEDILKVLLSMGMTVILVM